MDFAIEVVTTHGIECTVRDLRLAIMCSPAGESLPPIAEAEHLAGLAFLDLAQRAFAKSELWRVHALQELRR